MNATPVRKVWLVHGSYTGGHASAAKALQQALSAQPGVQADVINIADLSHSPLPMSTSAEKALEGGKAVNRLRAWWFEQNFKGNPLTYFVTNAAMRVEGLFSDAFLDRVEREKPDVIVSTMSATNALLSAWKGAGKLNVPVHSVVTDFSSHRIWAQENIDHYYVASEAARKDLERFGVDPSRIEQTGIPISPTFAGPARDAGEVRKSLGLDPTKATLLLLGGSLGYANFAPVLQALDKLDVPFQAVAITGRNETAREALEKMHFNHPVRVEGFVNNMADWADAADLVITKPGGLTTSELLARGRPMIIADPLPGLEEKMVGRVTETGAAIAVHGHDELVETTGRLLGDEHARGALQQAARQAGHRDAAAVVAQRVLAPV